VIKIVISLTIIEISIFMFLAMIGYVELAEAPILIGGENQVSFVDPLPQAMVLTAIVIGLATNAMLLSMAIRLYRKYGTFDVRKMKNLNG
jgi:multisubunit Na+/H+ antiporter MnhC subunit